MTVGELWPLFAVAFVYTGMAVVLFRKFQQRQHDGTPPRFRSCLSVDTAEAYLPTWRSGPCSPQGGSTSSGAAGGQARQRRRRLKRSSERYEGSGSDAEFPGEQSAHSCTEITARRRLPVRRAVRSEEAFVFPPPETVRCEAARSRSAGWASVSTSSARSSLPRPVKDTPKREEDTKAEMRNLAEIVLDGLGWAVAGARPAASPQAPSPHNDTPLEAAVTTMLPESSEGGSEVAAVVGGLGSPVSSHASAKSPMRFRTSARSSSIGLRAGHAADVAGRLCAGFMPSPTSAGSALPPISRSSSSSGWENAEWVIGKPTRPRPPSDAGSSRRRASPPPKVAPRRVGRRLPLASPVPCGASPRTPPEYSVHTSPVIVEAPPPPSEDSYVVLDKDDL
eukprot:Hpha_TRINITY_DN16217_c3_g8::TRINITY_DN16217_c3_g8_i1::g.12591::m.12591